MSTFTKAPFTGGPNGPTRGVGIVNTATPGSIIHTGPGSAGQIDEIWAWAVNSATNWVKLTFEWGGTTAPTDLIEVYLPPEDGLKLVIPGLIFQGPSASVLAAFASSGSVISVHGFVNQIR